MSRPLRLHVPGLLHHIFARGNDRARIFADDEDYDAFLELLAKALARFAVRCAAYCLMDNHYHLLLVPTAHALSRPLQQLNSSYCQRFNRRHGRVGHVLQGRFGCRIVEDGTYARTVLRYLALNPVAAGCVAAPEEWKWSSYRAALGLSPAPEFLSLADVWDTFATSENVVGRERLAECVRAGVEEVFENPLLHGSAVVAERVALLLSPHQATRDYPASYRFAARPTLGSLFEGRMGDRLRLQDAAFEAFYHHAYTLAEIGAVLSRHPSVVCRWIRRAEVRRGPVAVPSAEDELAKNKI